MKAKYIDKTFPITLQDLIDLAKSENQDPKDLKLIMNEHNPDYTGYVQCSALNPDGDSISIELYQANGYPQPQPKKDYIVIGQSEKAYHILDQIRDLTNVDIHIVSNTDLQLLEESYLILKAFYQKQQ